MKKVIQDAMRGLGMSDFRESVNNIKANLERLNIIKKRFEQKKE